MTSPPQIPLLLVDDHPIVLQGVSAALRNHYSVHTATDVDEAEPLLAAEPPPQVLLLDYNLPSGRAMEFLEQAAPLPPYVVILSGMTEPEDILYVLEKTPACAFVPKGIDLDDLPLALEELLKTGAPPPTPCVWDHPRRCFLDAEKAFPRGAVLTPREREVFMLLRQGLLDKQIADQLQRSIHTVRVQIRAIKRKRGATRRSVVDQ